MLGPYISFLCELCTTIVESFRGSRKFPVVIQTISVQKKIHRGGAEHAEKTIL